MIRSVRAFLWGGAVGAIAGLLFAPQRGEQTRLQLQKSWNNLQDQAQSKMQEVRGQTSSAIRQAQTAANKASETTQEQVSRTSPTY